MKYTCKNITGIIIYLFSSNRSLSPESYTLDLKKIQTQTDINSVSYNYLVNAHIKVISQFGQKMV